MKPILFNTDMVQAILEGRKSVTRRIVKPQPWGTCPNTGGDHELEPDNFCGGVATGFVCRRCGHGVCPPHMNYPVGEALFRPMCWPGDILYVRETWAVNNITPHDPEWLYKADYDYTIKPYKNWRWRPSIHMPKEAARLFLRVRNVRVERLLTPFFSDGAAVLALRQEGMVLPRECVECIGNYGVPACIDAGEDSECGILDEIRGDFSYLWNSTIKLADLDKYGWNANPWVWVIQFEQISKEEVTRNG